MSRQVGSEPEPSPFDLDPPTPGMARLLTCPALEGPKILHGFATRTGLDAQDNACAMDFGFGAADAARRVAWESLCQRLQTDPARLFTVRQIHGAIALHVDAQTNQSNLCESEADALITAVPGTAVAVRTADCVPVLLADPARGVVAAVHAGWRGTVAGILERTVQQMGAAHGCQAWDLVAAVGPAIGLAAFETGHDVAQQFAHLEGVVHKGASGQRPHLDLKLAACCVLRRCGLGRIVVSELCTFDRSDLFHSYRRDGARAGRQVSVIGLRG